MSSSENRVCVSTSVKDSFFDDPFFSDWWKDFDAPMQQTYDKAFQRQISGMWWFSAVCKEWSNMILHLKSKCHFGEMHH